MAKKPAPAAQKRSAPSLKLTEFTAATIAEAATATGARKAGGLYRVPIDGISVIPGFNLRITDSPDYLAGIEELRDSILIEGYFNSKPLTVFAAEIDGKPGIALIDGHRRYEALKAAIAEGADIETVPVTFREPDSSDLDLAVALEKENRSAPLTMLERGVLAMRMMKAGETEEAVAERLQVTVRHVNDLKTLLNAPKEIRDLVKTGKVSATYAVEVLRKDPEGKKLLEAAVKAEEKAKEKAAGERATRVTKQTVEDGDKAPSVKMATHRGNFQVKAGTEFAFEDVEPYLRIIGDEAWFKQARKQTMRVALEDVSVEVKVRRPAKPVEEDDAGLAASAPAKAPAKQAAPAKAPAKANGKAPAKQAAAKKGAAKAPATTGRGRREEASGEDLGLEDEAGEAPDLRNLGIVDRADAAGL